MENRKEMSRASSAAGRTGGETCHCQIFCYRSFREEQESLEPGAITEGGVMNSQTNCAVLFFSVRCYQGFLTAHLVSLVPPLPLGESNRSVTGSLAPNLCRRFPALAGYLSVQWEGCPCTVCSKGQIGRGGPGRSRAPVLTPRFLAG